jgi:hypothetical protein
MLSIVKRDEMSFQEDLFIARNQVNLLINLEMSSRQCNLQYFY